MIQGNVIGGIIRTPEITVDSELSNESMNPVQNKAITSKIENLESKIKELKVDSELSNGSTNPVQNKVITSKIENLESAIKNISSVQIISWEPTD